MGEAECINYAIRQSALRGSVPRLLLTTPRRFCAAPPGDGATVEPAKRTPIDLLAVRLLFPYLMELESLSRLGAMSYDDYRRLSNAFVSRYRNFAEHQEPIAVALAHANHSAADELTRARIDEMLAMLDHVHDPLIH